MEVEVEGEEEVEGGEMVEGVEATGRRRRRMWEGEEEDEVDLVEGVGREAFKRVGRGSEGGGGEEVRWEG